VDEYLLADEAEHCFVVLTSCRMLQANGRRMGRRDRCPFGQRPDPSDDSRMVDDPEEQEVIAEIRLLRAEGKGSKAIARALDGQGIACRGHGWNYSTVRAILRRSGQLAEAS
jgi:hypothetical protein